MKFYSAIFFIIHLFEICFCYNFIVLAVYINFYKPVEFGQIFNFRLKNAPNFNYKYIYIYDFPANERQLSQDVRIRLSQLKG